MDKILGLIDQDYFKRIRQLQWIQALTNHPRLTHYKKEISLRYRTSAAKLRAPVSKSDIHPLATSVAAARLIGSRLRLAGFSH